MADLRLEMPVLTNKVRHAANIGTRLDATTCGATGSLDLLPVVDAAVALAANVSAVLVKLVIGTRREDDRQQLTAPHRDLCAAALKPNR